MPASLPTEVFCDLWDCYGEAIALAQPPPPEPDYNLDTQHPLATPPTPISSDTPRSLTAARLWDARLATDNG